MARPCQCRSGSLCYVLPTLTGPRGAVGSCPGARLDRMESVLDSVQEAGRAGLLCEPSGHRGPATGSRFPGPHLAILCLAHSLGAWSGTALPETSCPHHRSASFAKSSGSILAAMEEDLLARSDGSFSFQAATARAWFEHRSRVQYYPNTIKKVVHLLRGQASRGVVQSPTAPVGHGSGGNRQRVMAVGPRGSAESDRLRSAPSIVGVMWILWRLLAAASSRAAGSSFLFSGSKSAMPTSKFARNLGSLPCPEEIRGGTDEQPACKAATRARGRGRGRGRGETSA